MLPTADRNKARFSLLIFAKRLKHIIFLGEIEYQKNQYLQQKVIGNKKIEREFENFEIVSMFSTGISSNQNI